MKIFNKTTLFSIGGLLLALVVIIVCLKFFLVNPKQKAIESRFVLNQSTEHTEDYMRLNNGIIMEMYNADYWINKRKDAGADTSQILLTNDRIAYLNYKNRRTISSNNIDMSLDEIGDIFNGEVAKQIIKDTHSYSDEMLNLEEIPRGINTKFGFSVNHVCLRKCPTDEPDYEDNSLYYDEMVQSDLRPFSPIVVLHESADKEWFYALACGYGGWIRKENVALCTDRDEWVTRKEYSDFLVVTGYELRIESDPYFDETANMVIPMGTVLPLASNDEISAIFAREDAERLPYGNYVAKLPERLDDGSVGDKYIFIPVSSDVSVGFLDYTEENVAAQALKYVGKVYGWGNSNNSSDCSGMVQNVFACFGLKLSRGATTQADTLDVEILDVERKSSVEKTTIFKELPVGTLLYFPGHIMMYLGTENGIPYCISSVGDISSQELGAGKTIHVNSVIVSDMLNTTRKSGQSWLESVEKIVILR